MRAEVAVDTAALCGAICIYSVRARGAKVGEGGGEQTQRAIALRSAPRQTRPFAVSASNCLVRPISVPTAQWPLARRLFGYAVSLFICRRDRAADSWAR